MDSSDEQVVGYTSQGRFVYTLAEIELWRDWVVRNRGIANSAPSTLVKFLDELAEHDRTVEF